MMLTGSAYLTNIIRMEAAPVGNGEVHLMFADQSKHLFSVTLEPDSAHALAQACAESLADSDMPDLWLMAPNPKADPEMLEAIGRDPETLRALVAAARARLDAIEAAIA